MQKPLTPRETEYEFYVRVALDHAQKRRRERRAQVIRKLTSWRRRPEAPSQTDDRSSWAFRSGL